MASFKKKKEPKVIKIDTPEVLSETHGGSAE